MHVKVSGSDRTCLEALQTYFFPSQNTQSLANVFWQDILTSIDIGHSPSSCIISNLIQLWSTCIQQQHFDPVEYIFKLLSFAFLNIYDNLLDADGIYTMLADSFQTTLEPYALARMKENTHALRLDQVKVLFECVLSAVDCPLHKSHLLRFWQVLRIDFILMLLNARQDIEIVHGTIKLLMSSVREDDFGPPCSADIRPRHSNLLLDASTRLLTESSRTLAASKKQQVRLDIIDFLHSIAFSGQPGITYLFNSNQVIPRLVKRISAELNSIYDQIEILDDSLRLIKKSVRTLHAIVTIHNPEHLAAKLASTLGAVHAHIEAMTRLSFGGDATDRLTDISDLARDLLELTVSPEEGDAIFELFES
ncbi:hypothetical protein NEOLI_000637 [Neolecta irregularis DAH-3]|uniref:Uncharacterized protein n=1 Tax=Neolecta irregularis (strain DAH-3) TaxID=1198029 RepID=A0A1U7LUD9_NEOID|nr:hypothetical protein NEOLI_000637 [Neolecta irregularis DAH-3]|eukprot:OLL26131.1 hypothetical protein NEOLI_000637 [Neolecta irregularis DAH-3]